MDDRREDQTPELTSRDPALADLAALCRALNAAGARYLVCGGFAIRAAGFAGSTSDIALLVDTQPANEAQVYRALESLPDQAVRALSPGDVIRYTVVRVADEIVVDLMASASGIAFPDAADEIEIQEVDGVAIPFASPRLLWRMKRHTHREKDQADLVFLQRLFAARGVTPPE